MRLAARHSAPAETRRLSLTTRVRHLAARARVELQVCVIAAGARHCLRPQWCSGLRVGVGEPLATERGVEVDWLLRAGNTSSRLLNAFRDLSGADAFIEHAGPMINVRLVERRSVTVKQDQVLKIPWPIRKGF